MSWINKTVISLFVFFLLIQPFTASALGFTIFPHNTAHDGAAVKILVEEAGGRVTDLYGNEQRWDTEITAYHCLKWLWHDRLVELSKEMITKSK